jgi:hypothetical protein
VTWFLDYPDGSTPHEIRLGPLPGQEASPCASHEILPFPAADRPSYLSRTDRGRR